ncbi:MAG TPA: hypothetical protein VIH31_00035 [Candidatus Paceibacterota bacterium]
MITREIVEYIKNELKKGSTREKITNDLAAGGGWARANIDEAFKAIGATFAPGPVYKPTPAPVPVITPSPVIISTPAPVITPIPASVVTPAPAPVVNPAPVSSPTLPVTKKMGNKMFILIGTVAVLLALAISYFSLANFIGTDNIMKIAAILAALYLVPILTMQFLTGKIPEHSWGKSILVTGAPSLIVSVYNLISEKISLPSVLGVIVLIGIIIGWIFFFSKIYQTGRSRAFKIGLFQVLINAIIIIMLSSLLV